MEQDNRKKPNIYLILCILFSIGALVCIGIWVKTIIDKNSYEDKYQSMVSSGEGTSSVASSSEAQPSSEGTDPSSVQGSDETGETESSEEVLDPWEKSVKQIEENGIPIPDLQVDLENLRQTVNKDIYAWIYIPGTKVNYPVLQHETNDDYYLDYNLDGKKGYPGCIYSQKTYNGKDFRDANTVLYGHNMKNGTMFGSLHKYEDEEFFYENRYAYVYTDERLLVYKIFAAYEHSNEHLLYNHNFENSFSFVKYFYMAKSDRTMHAIFDDEVELTGENQHVITLSTCINGKPEKRFLVQGVLINEE